MKILYATLFFLILSQSCESNRSEKTTTNNSDLLSLEHECIEKEFANDTSFLSSYMDSTFIELHGGGINGKHETLRFIYEDNIKRQHEGRVRDSFRIEEPVIHHYPSSAVVTFIIHTFNHKADSLYEKRTRFYDVWVKRADRWMAIAWQGTPLDK